MSAYKANRNGDSSNPSEKERADKNNAQNVRNAADVAIASGHPVAAAIGGAVKTADKITGGKASEGLGKAATKVMNKMPNGKAMQNASNKINESGAGDAIGKAAAMKNGAGGADENSGGEAPGKLSNSTSGLSNIGNKSKNKEKQELSGEGIGKINLKKILPIVLPIALGFITIIII